MKIVGPDEYPFSDRELPLDYEQNLTSYFASLFVPPRPRGDVFVDVGANVGTWTLRLAPFFRRVIAFEPDPRAFAALMKNAELNDLCNVELHRKAVGRTHKSGTLVFYDCPGHSAMEGNVLPRSEKTGETPVEIVALDHIELGGKLDLLKVDTEAYELEVLSGAARLLREERPRFCIENHSDDLRLRCRSLLESLGLPTAYAVGQTYTVSTH